MSWDNTFSINCHKHHASVISMRPNLKSLYDIYEAKMPHLAKAKLREETISCA
jgi:hypothetical protein